MRDVFPELVSELTALLEEEGEGELAVRARDLRLVAECGCGDDFCQSFKAEPYPAGRPFGPGHRCVSLRSSNGDLVLDVVDGRIMYVEVIDREPLVDLRGVRPE
ncbi:hypothetical protein ACIA8O_31205 [Kitasatospora sp. NPDC051853]|uniref:hypothetical protein n=1 Tax=Kitasatospora sp. NPDC051853 TaxID=3364058 RepID=UPI0037952BDC